MTGPSLALGAMDLFPLPGKCQGTAFDLAKFTANTDYDLDFNGMSKAGHVSRGACAGSGRIRLGAIGSSEKRRPSQRRSGGRLISLR